jgi:phosphatidylserine/phosphatidylglycerophosphate/cardiolipin synthase-like enzyme
MRPATQFWKGNCISNLLPDADGIMHNKFMIGDADDPLNAFIWTGSTNWTINQLTSDANHAYVIRDQALALNYRREFEEMWGNDISHTNSLVGENKLDNTGHRFQFNGIEIESYFSPSDEPDCHILQAISSADYQIQVGLLLLTSETLIDEIIALHHQGVDVRVILEDEESSQYAVDRLREDGIPLAIHDPSPFFTINMPLSMKVSGVRSYGSDRFAQLGPTVLITSMMKIHSSSRSIFCHIFRQEFEARWKELVPSATHENRIEAFSIYPNPAHSGFWFTNSFDNMVTLSMMDINGMEVQQFRIAAHENASCQWSQTLPGGPYVIKATWPDHEAVTRIVILPN